MTTQPAECADVLMALMAGLDGEQPSLSQEAIASHMQHCSACRTQAEALAALHVRLGDVRYEGPRVDLWPAVSDRLGEAANSRREWMTIAAMAAVCAAWRTAQLVFDLPLPVLNTVIPLIAVAGLGYWLVGDPLTIKMTTPELRQERA